jgi:hypothetical protein
MDDAAATDRRSSARRTPANDNRAGTLRAVRDLVETTLEGLLGVAGTIRCALLVAGI